MLSLNVADPLGFTVVARSKCYKRFDEPRPFAEAERVCNKAAGFGSETRHLMHIRDRAELLTATRLCRGYR